MTWRATKTILYPRGVMSRVDSQDIAVLFRKLSVNLGYESIWNSGSNVSVCIGFNLKFRGPKNPTTWQNATVQSVLSSVCNWRWTPQFLQKLVTQMTLHHIPQHFSVQHNFWENFKSFKSRFTPLMYSVQKAFTGDDKISELKENIWLHAAGGGIKSVHAETTKSKLIKYREL